MKRHAAQRAFTLIELLIAVVIFAVVLAAINTVFYSALRLRNRVSEALDLSQSVSQALTFVRRDLQGTMPPGGMLAAAFKIGPVSSGAGVAQTTGIEFYTTTGLISDDVPWGDLQKVTYQLREPLNRAPAAGKDLMRSVTRNLLTTATEEVLEQRLMGDVERLEFSAYTGTDWRESWDTTVADVGLPLAVLVRIQLAAKPGEDVRNRQPMEMMVPLLARAGTNQTQTTGGTP